MKNLEKFGVQELTTVEQRDVDGGLAPLVWVVIIVVSLLMTASERSK